MNIKVLGWYGHGNIGDEAYKAAFPLLFPKHDLEFVENISEGDNPDVLILGGGDVFYPSFTKYIEKLPSETRKIAASVSLTSNSDHVSLQKFEKVLVRDYRSALISSQKGYTSTYRPDFTFMLNPNAEAGKEWLKKKFSNEGHKLYDKVVVCIISNYLANAKLDMLARDLTAFMRLSQDVAKTADETNASFVFLPFSTKSPWDDRVSNGWVADRCKFYDKNLVIYDRLDVQTTLNIIASANAVVSSRLHGSIFSTLSGVRFIDLTHHTKNLGFLETIEKTSWSMPFWEFSIKDFKKTLNEFLASEQRSASLQKFSKLAKENLQNAIIL